MQERSRPISVHFLAPRCAPLYSPKSCRSRHHSRRWPSNAPPSLARQETCSGHYLGSSWDKIRIGRPSLEPQTGLGSGSPCGPAPFKFTLGSSTDPYYILLLRFRALSTHTDALVPRMYGVSTLMASSPRVWATARHSPLLDIDFNFNSALDAQHRPLSDLLSNSLYGSFL